MAQKLNKMSKKRMNWGGAIGGYKPQQKQYSILKNIFSPTINFSEITFKEGFEKYENYYPALAIVGLKADPNSPYDGWLDMVGWMKSKGFFKRGGEVKEIHPISLRDSIKGNTAVILIFSKNTEISPVTRLLYKDNFKWLEDFFDPSNPYFKWYRSSKSIRLKQHDYSGKPLKLVRGVKKTINRAGTWIDNAGLKAGDRVKQTFTGKEPVNKGFKFRPKSNTRINRETIQLRNEVNKVMRDPGGTTGKVLYDTMIEPAKKAPIGTVVSQISPIPGAGLAFAKKGAPIEAKLWDKSGIGPLTKPLRNKLDKVASEENIKEAGRGIYRGIKNVVGA